MLFAGTNCLIDLGLCIKVFKSDIIRLKIWDFSVHTLTKKLRRAIETAAPLSSNNELLLKRGRLNHLTLKPGFQSLLRKMRIDSEILLVHASLYLYSKS
jgi:hypothetical protein